VRAALARDASPVDHRLALLLPGSIILLNFKASLAISCFAFESREMSSEQTQTPISSGADVTSPPPADHGGEPGQASAGSSSASPEAKEEKVYVLVPGPRF
jgi:hypothetical protein